MPEGARRRVLADAAERTLSGLFAGRVLSFDSGAACAFADIAATGHPDRMRFPPAIRPPSAARRRPAAATLDGFAAGREPVHPQYRAGGTGVRDAEEGIGELRPRVVLPVGSARSRQSRASGCPDGRTRRRVSVAVAVVSHNLIGFPWSIDPRHRNSQTEQVPDEDEFDCTGPSARNAAEVLMRRGNRSAECTGLGSGRCCSGSPSSRRESSMSGATPEAHRVTLPRSRMRESRTPGSVRRAPGGRRLYSTHSTLGNPLSAGCRSRRLKNEDGNLPEMWAARRGGPALDTRRGSGMRYP